MNNESVMYRQVHPSFLQNGHPTTQAFRPTPKDQSLLSVYNGDMISAHQAWVHYTSILGCSSSGCMGLSIAECQSVSLSVRPDPVPFPEHSVIDFSALSENECRRKSKILQQFALARGWLYRSQLQ